MTRGSVRERLRSNPEELFIAALAAVSGIGLTFGAPRPQSVEALLPHAIVAVWGVYLAIGGSFVVVGMFLRGFSLEVSGLVLLGSGCIAYAIVALGFAGWGGAVSALFLIGYATACLVRARLLLQLLSIVKENGHSAAPRVDGSDEP